MNKDVTIEEKKGSFENCGTDVIECKIKNKDSIRT